MDHSLNFAPVVAPADFDPTSGRPAETVRLPPVSSAVRPTMKAGAGRAPVRRSLLDMAIDGGERSVRGAAPDAGKAASRAAGKASAIDGLERALVATGEELQGLAAAMRRLERERATLAAQLAALRGEASPQPAPAAPQRRDAAYFLGLLSSGEPPQVTPGATLPKASWG